MIHMKCRLIFSEKKKQKKKKKNYFRMLSATILNNVLKVTDSEAKTERDTAKYIHSITKTCLFNYIENFTSKNEIFR